MTQTPDTQSSLDDIERFKVIEAERDMIITRLTDKASEWYRQDSGRTHFHRPVLVDVGPAAITFYTPVRDGDIWFDVPLEWFA